MAKLPYYLKPKAKKNLKELLPGYWKRAKDRITVSILKLPSSPVFINRLGLFLKKPMWTLANFKSIYTRYESSGLRVRDFCRNESIAESKFYYWQKQMERTRHQEYRFVPILPSGSGSFVPGIPGDAVPLPVTSSVPIPSSGCEIIYPDGTILRPGACDIHLLKQ
jgi:hypothetical protein